MKYFDESEFVMGSENVYEKMDGTFLARLDDLRDSYGHPITITSSYRSPEYNRNIGGSSKSKHMEGIAVDIAMTDSTLRAKLVYYALQKGLSVGVSRTFVHIDGRDNQIMFTYG